MIEKLSEASKVIMVLFHRAEQKQPLISGLAAHIALKPQLRAAVFLADCYIDELLHASWLNIFPKHGVRQSKEREALYLIDNGRYQIGNRQYD